MSSPTNCCQPCPEVQTVNVPGSPGPDGLPGTNGKDGSNAFTFTTADFVVPAIGSPVTILVLDSTWMTVGQNVFVQGAGYFSVTSKPSNLSATLTYLNYTGNTNTGNNIVSGAQVSPGGTEPSGMSTVSSYHLAGSQALTLTPSQLLTASITLPSTGTYLLLATARIDYVAATTLTQDTVALKLRRTNNTPADIANAVVNVESDIVSNKTETLSIATIAPVTYAGTVGDIVQVFGATSALPYAGNLEAIEVNLLAIKLL